MGYEHVSHHSQAISTGRLTTFSGGHAPSFLYRIIADHYRAEDTELDPQQEDDAVI